MNDCVQGHQVCVQWGFSNDCQPLELLRLNPISGLVLTPSGRRRYDNLLCMELKETWKLTPQLNKYFQGTVSPHPQWAEEEVGA